MRDIELYSKRRGCCVNCAIPNGLPGFLRAYVIVLAVRCVTILHSGTCCVYQNIALTYSKNTWKIYIDSSGEDSSYVGISSLTQKSRNHCQERINAAGPIA